MNTFVKFELAKLLKEKGFVCIKSDKFWRDGFSLDKKDYNPIAYQDKDNIATIGEVIMWLYEKYGIWISVYSGKALNWESLFSVRIDWIYPTDSPDAEDIEPQYFKYEGQNEFNSPTEAYETAIEYCLTKLL